MKTYFLTGGEGFIGYHITKKLLEDKGNNVITYDAQKHYIPFDKSKWAFFQGYRIKSLLNERLIRLRGDCTDFGWLKECIEKYKPEVIIHLAALPIASVSNDYPTEAKVNILDSTITLLEVLKTVNFKIDRLIYTSSSMVYGNFLRNEKDEIIPATEDQICNPIDIYGAMKLSGEYIVKVYNHRFKIPYTIIRPSAVYGPTDCNRRVTEIFLTNALEGKKLILDNGGKHQLDFTYIDDLVEGYILTANSENALNQTFNLTRGKGRQIKDLAEIIGKFLPGTEIIDSNIKPYRPNRGTLDISKARGKLGFEPKYDLEKGIQKYFDFMKKFD
ncbi:NAD-dependent epimerase/dehydratase family protein [candidate division KSB1 bacterium]